MLKKLFTILLLSGPCLLLYFFSFSKTKEPKEEAQQWQAATNGWYRQGIKDFLVQLQTLQNLHRRKASLAQFTRQFQQVRRSFKKVEMLLAYFDERPFAALNGRLLPQPELEKGIYEHIAQPHGLQVIESFLEDSVTYSNAGEAIKTELRLAIQTATFLQRFPFTRPYTDAALQDAVSRQLLRLAAMGVTGFDKPVLDDALAECRASLQGISALLNSLGTGNVEMALLKKKVRLCIFFLQQHKIGFSSFNRLQFIRSYLQPAFAASQCWKASMLPDSSPVYTSFFDKDYIDQLYHYDPGAYPAEMVELGKALFGSKIMSRNGRISCTTCHQPALAFADTVPHHFGFELTDTLLRNTPSLLNVAYHLRFQRDGHLLFLRDQFREVIFNHAEMGNLDESTLLRRIQQTSSLWQRMVQVFPAAKDSLTIDMALKALEAFVHSLVSTQSSFDQYMTGKTDRIAPAVQRGFNLFMGRAKCGTCHFMPVFNGVQPPFFKTEENEIIGVLRDNNFNRPKLDTADKGLFLHTGNELHRFSFKVPTVRGLAKTFPYMHNGSLKNLDELLLFYNLGGGGGWMMGAEVPNQTLDREPLKLDKEERDDIKAFLLSLE